MTARLTLTRTMRKGVSKGIIADNGGPILQAHHSG